ncbi:MAG: hypothetical protein JWO57_2348 [Pseudonocardiales bacterium]|nr:hypothetical protein [Pseudonocardiales bacterium]
MTARRLRRGWLVALVALLASVVGAGVAFAFWTATDSTHSAQAAADVLPAGQTPTAVVSSPGGVTTATITFNRLTTTSGRTVSAFVVNRYSTSSGGAPAATFACTPGGTGASVSCTESAVPAGTWYYSDTPAVSGSLWQGTESARSNAVTTDTVAPSVTYSQTPVANGNGYNSTTVSATLTATDNLGGSGVGHITYSIDGGTSVQVNAATATFNVSGDGTHTVAFTATDNAGNTSTSQSQTVKIDSTPPNQPVITSTPSVINVANKTSISIGGTAEPGTNITLTLTDVGSVHTVTAATAATGGNWSFASLDPSGLNDGTVTVKVTATDLAGNASTPPAQTTIAKDTVAPTAPSITTPASGSFINSSTNSASYTVSGAKEASTSLVLTVTDPGAAHTVTKTITFSAGTSWSTTIDTTGLNQGVISYSAVASDAAGNAGAAGTTSNTKDTVAPTITVGSVTDPINNSNQTATSASGSVSDANATAVSVVAGDGISQTTAVNAPVSSGTWSASAINVSALNNGTIMYTATATDAAGNTNTATRTATKSAATKFAVTAGATQTAGSAFNVTVTAQDNSGATIASYSGSHTLTLSTTAGNSPSGATPTVPSGTLTFSGGTATASFTFVKAEASRTITATDGTLTGTSAAITVNAGTASRLAWTHVSVSAGTLSSPCLFTCTDTALGNNANFTANVSVTDSLGNTETNLGAGHTVTVSTPASGGAFTSPSSGISVTLTISSSGAADSAAPFTFKTQNGSWTSDAITAATLAGTSYLNATATVTKQ